MRIEIFVVRKVISPSSENPSLFLLHVVVPVIFIKVFNDIVEPTTDAVLCASKVVNRRKGKFTSEDARVVEFLTATNPLINWTK